MKRLPVVRGQLINAKQFRLRLGVWKNAAAKAQF
jgi:hypothetical protein